MRFDILQQRNRGNYRKLGGGSRRIPWETAIDHHSGHDEIRAIFANQSLFKHYGKGHLALTIDPAPCA